MTHTTPSKDMLLMFSADGQQGSYLRQYVADPFGARPPAPGAWELANPQPGLSLTQGWSGKIHGPLRSRMRLEYDNVPETGGSVVRSMTGPPLVFDPPPASGQVLNFGLEYAASGLDGVGLRFMVTAENVFGSRTVVGRVDLELTDTDTPVFVSLTDDGAWDSASYEPSSYRVELAVEDGGAAIEAAWLELSVVSIIGPTSGADAIPFPRSWHFDGDSHSSGQYRYSWDGTPFASTATSRLLGTPLEDERADLLSVSTTRGGRQTAVTLEPQAGSATLTLANNHVPTFHPGRAIILAYLDPKTGTMEPIFTGKVTDAEATVELVPGPARRTRVVTTVSLADGYDALANTKRYSVAASSWENTTDRVARLMESAQDTGLGWVVDPNTPQGTEAGNLFRQVSAYVHESSVANHLQIAANTALCGWCLDRDNRVHFRAPAVSLAEFGGVPRTTTVAFTDGTDYRPVPQDVPQETVSYVAIRQGMTTRDHVNTVTLESYTRELNDEGTDYVQRIVEETTQDNAARLSYGPRHATIKVAAEGAEGGGEVLTALGMRYAQLRPVELRPTMVRLNVTRYGLPPGIDVLEVLDLIAADYAWRVYVTKIKHTITPDRWLVEYELGQTPANLNDYS